MSAELDDLLDMIEAGELAGRQAVTMRSAAELGRLEARRFGTGPRAVWVTTRGAVSEYLAYVAAAAWTQQPQRVRRPGSRRRRRERDPVG